MSGELQGFVLIEDERDLPLLTLARPLGDAIALHVGVAAELGPRAARALSLARDRGAARTIAIADAALADVDYLAIAHVLACAVRHIADARPAASVVVLAGDRGRGAVGPAVAERLGLPHLCAVRAASTEGGLLRVDRLCGAELRRFVGAPPAVLACALPHAADGKTGDDVSGPEPERLTLDALRITVPELQYRRRFRPQDGVGPSRRPHVVANVEHLADCLVRDGLWPVPRSS